MMGLTPALSNWLQNRLATFFGVGTTNLVVPNGSAAAPSIAFVGQPTTGFYWVGNQLHFSVGGVDRGYFDANNFLPSGSIGVGAGNSYIQSVANGVIKFRNNADTAAASLTGTATNDDAAAACVGEFSEATAAAGAITPWVAGTPQNITSLSLTAGDWDVDGTILWQNTGTVASNFIAALGTASANIGAANDAGRAERVTQTLTASLKESLVCPTRRFSLSATTTVYLVGQAGGTMTNLSAGGRLRARRVR